MKKTTVLVIRFYRVDIEEFILELIRDRPAIDMGCCGGRDRLMLVLLWYSCLMSVCFLYFAHERAEFSTTIRVSQRGIAIGDPSSLSGEFVLPSAARNLMPWKAQVVPGSKPTLSSNLATGSGELEDKIIATDESGSTTRAPNEHNGYVNVVDGSTLKYHCNQCSLVSSSGQLLDKGGGYDIDQSNCIIRMNSAPVRGYEDDVGSRTTIRVIGHVNLGKGIHNDTDLQQELFGDASERPDVVIVPWLYLEEINKTSDPAWNTAMNLSKWYPDVKFYVLTPEKMNLSESIFTREVGLSRQEAHTWLSTGWMTMLFALDVCDEIDVFGLVPDDHCKTHPNDTSLYHYFEPDFKQECDYYHASESMLRYGHKFITEKAVFAKWSLNGQIHFHYPSWVARPKNDTILDTPFLRTYREALQNGSLAALQAIPKKKVIKKKKIIRVIRRKKKPKQVVADAPKQELKSGAFKVEETVLVLNSSKDGGKIPEGRDPDSMKRAEMMRMARRKIIRSRRHKSDDIQS